jgi:hypothetical protein
MLKAELTRTTGKPLELPLKIDNVCPRQAAALRRLMPLLDNAS